MERTEDKLIVKTKDDKIQEIPFVTSDSMEIDTDNYVKEIKGECQIVCPPQEARKTLLVTTKAAQSAKEDKRLYLE